MLKNLWKANLLKFILDLADSIYCYLLSKNKISLSHARPRLRYALAWKSLNLSIGHIHSGPRIWQENNEGFHELMPQSLQIYKTHTQANTVTNFWQINVCNHPVFLCVYLVWYVSLQVEVIGPPHTWLIELLFSMHIKISDKMISLKITKASLRFLWDSCKDWNGCHWERKAVNSKFFYKKNQMCWCMKTIFEVNTL